MKNGAVSYVTRNTAPFFYKALLLLKVFTRYILMFPSMPNLLP